MQRAMQALVLGAMISASSLAAAGDLYGNVRDEQGAGVAGAEVKVTIADQRFTATTSRGGFYRIRVQPTGQGRLTVTHQGRESNPIRVYSFPNSVRWDLRIDAGHRLRRE